MQKERRAVLSIIYDYPIATATCSRRIHAQGEMWQRRDTTLWPEEVMMPRGADIIFRSVHKGAIQDSSSHLGRDRFGCEYTLPLPPLRQTKVLMNNAAPVVAKGAEAEGRNCTRKLHAP